MHVCMCMHPSIHTTVIGGAATCAFALVAAAVVAEAVRRMRAWIEKISCAGSAVSVHRDETEERRIKR